MCDEAVRAWPVVPLGAAPGCQVGASRAVKQGCRLDALLPRLADDTHANWRAHRNVVACIAVHVPACWHCAGCRVL